MISVRVAHRVMVLMGAAAKKNKKAESKYRDRVTQFSSALRHDTWYDKGPQSVHEVAPVQSPVMTAFDFPETTDFHLIPTHIRLVSMFMIFVVMLCYLSSSERNAWTGLEPWPLRCRCSAPPVERVIRPSPVPMKFHYLKCIGLVVCTYWPDLIYHLSHS